jgi:hypothetical protein
LTDPIGFRVDAPPVTLNTSEDRAAEEFDTSTYVVRVDGHSDYPRSLTYLAVLLDAIGVQNDGRAQPDPQTESQRRGNHPSILRRAATNLRRALCSMFR